MIELIPRRYLDLAHQGPNKTALLANDGGRLVEETHARLRVDVLRAAQTLMQAGLVPGERVLVMLPSGRLHTVVDLAVLCCGGVAVPVYETDSAEQVSWIVENCGPLLAVVDGSMREVYDAVENAGSMVALGPDRFAPGDDVDHGVEVEMNARVDALRGEDPACIIYTSGTTGRSKGCTLSHANLAAGVAAAQGALPELFGETDRTVLFLPLAHVFARVVQYGCITAGVPFGYSTPTRLVEEISVFTPTWLTVVPRVLEKVYASAESSATGVKRRIFDLAVAQAIEQAQRVERGVHSTGVLWKLCDKLVYAKLRAKLGGRLRYLLSGGAPLDARLDRFFTGAGMVVMEGYGLSETTAAHTVNRPGAKRAGTVGTPLSGMEVRIAETGEVLLKGPNVFAGYWGDEAATAAGFDGEWLRTGDLGSVDAAGFLTITGRIKELLVTAGGKNVQPAGLEEIVARHPAVAQCVVVGDRRPFIAALVALDPAWVTLAGVPEEGREEHPAVRGAVQDAIDVANASVSRAESIRAWRMLPRELSVEAGELTPTLKLKRRVVEEHHGEIIEEIYRAGERAE